MDDLKFYEDYWRRKKIQGVDEESIWKARMLLSIIPKKDYNAIAEMGCGTGSVLNLVAQGLKAPHRIGVELSNEALISARQQNPQLSNIQGDVTYPPLKKGSVDLIILSDIIEHLSKPVDFLKDISKISDYMALNIPVEKSLFPKSFEKLAGVKNPIETHEHLAGHLFEWTTNEVEQLLGKANLKIIDSKLARPPKEFFRSNNKDRRHQIAGRLSEYSLVNVEKAAYNFSPKLHSRLFHAKYFAFVESED
jgi:ubiquinone/menaquinone biosynthesis C-methylase UbiE